METKPTPEQRITAEQIAATNNETRKHIANVGHFINKIVTALLERSEQHDQTKLLDPEAPTFAEFTHKLSGLTFGSEEYKKCLKDMGPALEHHYAKNRHHPEHFKGGINDMNIIDFVEMFCDWKAATMRHDNGNLEKSIDYNADKFHIPAEMVRIMKNTIAVIEA